MDSYLTPRTLLAANTVLEGRCGTEKILRGDDDRLMVVVGYICRVNFRLSTLIAPTRPCSVHNVEAAIEYAKLLQKYAESAKNDLHIVMRVYFEKPRTTLGWKGLINDPWVLIPD